MPRGRPRIHKTPEQVAAAKCAKASRYYDKNRDLVNEKRRDVYHKKVGTSTSDTITTQNPGPSTSLKDAPQSPRSWLAQAREIPKLLVKHTQTNHNVVYFTRLYFEYLRLEGEADQETALKMITDNESTLSGLMDMANNCFKHIYEEKGCGKGAVEARDYIRLIKDVQDGVMHLWEAGIIANDADEFKELVRNSPVQLDV